ncbi:hypothetical protein BQ8794_70126 [Mesorhizobium prunaredense]|uniref:Uncharacterized protein n=1 Tax=Mesorhizobium prunaredense TaxID=1631249 RepID=A0A1R3VGY6_9HYPH|nr:hypothetical protein BQ8794_70126 [Mesorhizobium prunaredense]
MRRPARRASHLLCQKSAVAWVQAGAGAALPDVHADVHIAAAVRELPLILHCVRFFDYVAPR